MATKPTYEALEQRIRVQENAVAERDTILEHLPDSIIVQDLDHVILWGNTAACRSLNRPLSEITGRRCHELCQSSSIPCPECPTTKSLEQGPNEHQVIDALIVNAWEAMRDDIPGKITVSTGTVSSPPGPNKHPFPVDRERKGSPQIFACLTITDTGKGMDTATIEKIFDPFFTEKFTGRGMGLPTALGNINAHGGCITVESTPGKGSTFQIFLPLSVQSFPQTT